MISQHQNEERLCMFLNHLMHNEKRKQLRSVFFSFDSFCFAELSPVCAIVGGVIGQEIIKVITPYVSVLLLHGRNRKIKQKVNLIHDLIWI